MEASTPKINEGDLIRAVRALASRHPSDIYVREAGCLYDRGKCGPGEGCIIGQAMQSLGKEYLYRGLEDMPAPELALGISLGAEGWVLEVQRRQDSCCTWGFAVEKADEAYPEVASKFPL